MNPTFEQISCSDAARMIGTTKCTVNYWCRKGLVNYTDISSPKSSAPRYVLTEEEVERIKKPLKNMVSINGTNIIIRIVTMK